MFTLNDAGYKNILDIPHLNIPAGAITCIVGESGSGKTTLLRLLNQLTSHDRGVILFEEQDVAQMNPVELRRQAVMLSQSPYIFTGTVLENLQAGLRLTGQPLADEESILQAMSLVHLKKGLAEPVAKLSGGEKQRLGLARVILMTPKVFLLDEPSAALDEDTEDLVIAALAKHVAATGKTMVMVTHSRRIARDYGDLIVEIHHGKLVKGGEKA